MPTNSAAWIRARGAQLEVGPAPYTPPGEDQIVVRNHAVAVNPLDWIVQVAGPVAYRWLNYPTVLGSDVAGEVAEVGSAITRFRVGDRVLGHAVGTDKDSNRAAEGGFQTYTLVLERMASPIPDSLAYDSACVLPLALSTAACALFQSDQLALHHPSTGAEPTGQTVLVWGGSTSVGSNAIQLAVAAGYEVLTTASPRNADYVTSLGASRVFDYQSPTVVPDLVVAFAGRTLAGAVAIGTGSAEGCADVVRRCTGRRFVSIASTPVSFDSVADPNRSRLELPRLLAQVVSGTAALQVKSRLRGISTKFVIGTTVKTNEVSTAIYQEFLPAALAEGRYLAAPEPNVVGHSLGDIQHAIDLQRQGVSAQKIVVSLAERPAGANGGSHAADTAGLDADRPTDGYVGDPAVQAEWDNRYADREQLWSGQPNRALVAEVAGLTPGRVLDVGCAEGADAVWLASGGWQVTGLEVSGVALERAAGHARDAGVTIRWMHAGLVEAAIPPASFDLVCALYPALLRTPDCAAERALLSAVVPGGVLLLVHHAGMETRQAHQGDFDPADYVWPSMIAALLDDDWQVELNEQRPRVAPEGGAGAHHTDDVVLRARRLR